MAWHTLQESVKFTREKRHALNVSETEIQEEKIIVAEVIEQVHQISQLLKSKKMSGQTPVVDYHHSCELVIQISDHHVPLTSFKIMDRIHYWKHLCN